MQHLVNEDMINKYLILEGKAWKINNVYNFGKDSLILEMKNEEKTIKKVVKKDDVKNMKIKDEKVASKYDSTWKPKTSIKGKDAKQIAEIFYDEADGDIEKAREKMNKYIESASDDEKQICLDAKKELLSMEEENDNPEPVKNVDHNYLIKFVEDNRNLDIDEVIDAIMLMKTKQTMN